MKKRFELMMVFLIYSSFRFGPPAGEKRVYVDLPKKPTGAANLTI
jgi:hypothetical protein